MNFAIWIWLKYILTPKYKDISLPKYSRKCINIGTKNCQALKYDFAGIRVDLGNKVVRDGLMGSINHIFQGFSLAHHAMDSPYWSQLGGE